MSDYKELFAADEQARKQIEERTDRNFFVEASAGSGKTTALVNRMIALVRSGVPVSKICAITFTKAAAKEFYHRFQHRLSLLCGDSSVSEEHRALYTQALTDIDLCFTGTIDAFCNTVLSEHPLEAKIPPDASILSDDDLAKSLSREYLRVARGEYGDVMKEKYLQFCAVNSSPDKVFSKNILHFLDTRHTQLIFAPPRIPDSALMAKKQLLLEMLDEIKDSSDDLLYLNSSRKKSGPAYEGRKKIFEDLCLRKDELAGDWMDDISNVLGILRFIVKKIELIPKLDPLFLQKYEGLLKEKLTPKGSLSLYLVDPFGEGSPGSALREYQHSVSLDFLSSFASLVAEELRASGELTFFDYLLYLRDMLREDAAEGGLLTEHIYNRHSYFLIDEFQDTNPLQAEVFFYLTAQNPDPDWRRCIPRPGSLFIVGDPKQSIYRFRNADVSSFLKVKEMFEDPRVGEVLYLYRNFRSTPALCRWFNHHFQRMMPEQTDTQSRFSPIPLDDSAPELDEAFGSVYHYVMQTNSDDATQTGIVIERLVKSKKYKIRGENGKLRSVNYGDIMVITPTRTRLHNYLAYFRSRNIPVYIEGDTDFGSCAILCAMSVLLNAVANPTNSVKLFSALRSVPFAIGHSELSRWIAQGNRLTLMQDPVGEEEEFTQVRQALGQLRELYRAALDMTASAAAEAIVDRLQLFSACNSDNLEYFYFALELLRQAEISGEISSLAQAARFLDDLVTNSEPERCITLMKETNRVHIANLHKVKGLEAPVVILASPKWRSHNSQYSVDYSQNPPASYCFSLNDASSETIQFTEEQELENERHADEKTRLMYVAATRARDMLIIAEVRTGKDELSTENPWNVFLGEGLSEIAPMPVNPDPSAGSSPDVEAIYDLARKTNVFGDRESEEESYIISRPSQIKVRGRSDSEELPDEFTEESVPEHIRNKFSRLNAAVLGTMVHQLLEALVSSGGKTDVKTYTRFMRDEYRLDESIGDQLVQIVTEVGEKMLGGGYPQSNGMPADLLAELASADKVMTEVPFCLKTQDGDSSALTHGIMDLVYLKDGRWRIVDYKTSEKVRDLDRHYDLQLSAYREAFRQLTGFEAEAKVYHIDA